VITFREHYNNAHVINVDGALVLIDAGLEADAPGLDARLRERGLDPAVLGAVVLTHGHADHAGGARWFQEQYGTPIVVAAADVGLLDEGENGDLCPTDDDARAREADDEAETFTPYAPDVRIGGSGEASTDLQSVAGIAGRIAFVPGHTDGSLAVVVGNAAFVGDLFRGDVFSGAARVHFYNCDLEDNRDDIRALLDNEAANVDEFFVGHFGPVSRVEVEKLLEQWPAAPQIAGEP
jgi:hydroxyacylglutathione hydrolase